MESNETMDIKTDNYAVIIFSNFHLNYSILLGMQKIYIYKQLSPLRNFSNKFEKYFVSHSQSSIHASIHFISYMC